MHGFSTSKKLNILAIYMLKKYPKALDHITDYWSAKIHFLGGKNPHLSYNTRVEGVKKATETTKFAQKHFLP